MNLDISFATPTYPEGRITTKSALSAKQNRPLKQSKLLYNNLLLYQQKSKKMIDHVIITVSNFERSVAFYTNALKPLGITMAMDFKGQNGHPDLKGFGDGNSIFLWLKEGKAYPEAVHAGFVAKDHAEVDAFYKAAVAAGAQTKDAPRVFNEYYPGYYAAWILDPDGYEIELVHKS